MSTQTLSLTELRPRLPEILDLMKKRSKYWWTLGRARRSGAHARPVPLAIGAISHDLTTGARIFVLELRRGVWINCRLMRRNRKKRDSGLPKEEPIELTGVVTDVLGNSTFRIEVQEGHQVIAKIAGRMRRSRIRVLPNDRVRIEVSPYDLHRGRIVYRYK